jgi:hypothetical protein
MLFMDFALNNTEASIAKQAIRRRVVNANMREVSQEYPYIRTCVEFFSFLFAQLFFINDTFLFELHLNKVLSLCNIDIDIKSRNMY